MNFYTWSQNYHVNGMSDENPMLAKFHKIIYVMQQKKRTIISISERTRIYSKLIKKYKKE